MDKNSIIGLLLIFAIIMGYSWYTQPSEEELAKSQNVRDSIALLHKDTASQIAGIEKDSAAQEVEMEMDSSELASQFGGFANHVKKDPVFAQISNDKLEIKISNKGAKPVSAVLKEFYVSDSSRKVNLIDSANARFGYKFSTKEGVINTENFYWKVHKFDATSVSMRMYYGSYDKYLEQKYTLTQGDYKVAYEFNVVGMENDLAPGNSSFLVNYSNAMPLQELELEAERRTATAWFKYVEESPDDMSVSGEDDETLEASTEWISFSQQFFNTTLIPEKVIEKGTKIVIEEGGEDFVRVMKADYKIPYKHTASESFKMDIFMGPNQYYTLQAEGKELERLVPLGPVIIRHINKFVIYLFDLLKNVTNSYGLIIFLMTLLIKMVLFPLVYKSYKSMAKMKVLKPEVDAIKEKYEGDMQKIQQENMKLYKKAGVNPAGGCLPMIVQMPVLFAIFRFFPSAFELRQQGFLWAEDLSRYDSIMSLGFEIPFYGAHISLFTLLMTVTTLVYTRFNNQMSGATGQMKWIGYLMPIMFLGFFNNYASGLTYYYFVSTLITFGQQLAIKKFFIDEDKIKLQIAENKKNPKKQKTSGFQKRLEDMANKQKEANKYKK